MCGIAGYIGKNELTQETINHTLDSMKNRGPDKRSFKTFKSTNDVKHFLHSRLSIIDLHERADQPFTMDGCTIIFNGEIYNYLELRTFLEKEGHNFKTQSDTEVLLKYYLVYGEGCVSFFEGMWAFAIYDSRQEITFISRDRFGEKPLYYYQDAALLYFGSEIKFLKAMTNNRFRINESQLLRYMVNGYKSLYKHGETFYQNVHEVPAGTNFVIKNNQIEKKRYWTPSYNPVAMTTKEAIEGAKHHLMESLRIRLRSDVPLVFCLSGGVDSSTLASIAAKAFNYKVITYSILDNDERYNEYENIKATVDDLGCESHYIELNHQNSISRLKDLISYHDGPIATITYFVHSQLSEAISKDGHRVVISGTSADELFTGYYDHFNLHLYEMRNHPSFNQKVQEWKDGIGKHVRNPILQNPCFYIENPQFRDHIYFQNDIFAEYLTKPFKEDFFENQYTSSLLRNRMLNELMVEATPVILHEDDLNSMRYSLENRSPYLDTRLFNFANSIPSELLIQKGFGKYLLREAGKGYLNDKVRLDVQKKGFNASIHSVFDLKGKETQEYLLENGPLFDIIKRDRFTKLFESDYLENSDSKFLFSIINAKMFLDM